MRLSLMELAVVGVLAIWLLLSIAVYIPAFHRGIRANDHLSLVPEWRFFAPRPGRQDYHLLYRDVNLDGSVSNWTEVRVAKPRRFWCTWWNPGKRNTKALFDCTQELGRRLTQDASDIELSIPYLTILNHLASVERLGMPSHMQFAIFTTEGMLRDPDANLLFLSHPHHLK